MDDLSSGLGHLVHLDGWAWYAQQRRQGVVASLGLQSSVMKIKNAEMSRLHKIAEKYGTILGECLDPSIKIDNELIWLTRFISIGSVLSC